MTTLREAAQAVLDRWDDPHSPTAEGLADLRKALEAPEQEPVGYFFCDDEHWQQAHDPIGFAAHTPLYAAPVEAPDIKVLQAQCDAFLANVQLLEAEIEAMTKERDALLAKIDLANRKFAVLNNENAFENLYQAGLEQEREITKLTKERDALSVAGKLVVEAMDRGYMGKHYSSYREAYAALKSAGAS